MRILHISSARTFGGGERHLVDLCRGLGARGHEIFVALRPTSEWQERFDFLPPGRIFHSSIRNSFGIFSSKKIAKFINDNNIEIIHAHVARDYIPASLACRISNRGKFILTRHVLFPMKPFHRFALQNVERVIAVSSAAKANLQNIFPKEKIAIVPNGIEVENWASADKKGLREEFRFLHGIPSDAALVGTAGELKELKGQRDFVLAALETAKKFPNAHFVMVGKDNSVNQTFRGELKRLVKVFGLEDRFLFLDWVEDTAPLLAALDIFVSPSHSESFGLAILEAMASAAAIVATETEGAKELLQTGEAGSLVPVKQPLRLAEAINGLLVDEKRRFDLGRNAQAAARSKFGLEKMVEATENLYREILS